MRVGSLFSGVGGFDLGLEAAGMEVVWQVEYDEQAASVLRHHWPDVDLYKDVCDVGAANLARVDLICGGFPCQDLSVAGRRAGLDGERSGLFYEFMRIVGELAPRWVLIENVPGLLSSNGGRDMGAVLGTLGDLGYGWTYRVVDTQYFGPPQRRRRVFIVGCAGGFCPPEVLLEPESLPWNPAPSRAAGEGTTHRVAGSLAASGRGVERAGESRGQDPVVLGGVEGEGRVAGTLEARAEVGGTVAQTLTVGGRDKGAGSSYDNTPVVAHTRAEGHDASEDGTGRGTPIVAPTLRVGGREQGAGDGPDNTPIVAYRASDYSTGDYSEDYKAGALTGSPDTTRRGIVLPFDTTQVTSKGNYSRPKPGDPCHPLAAGAHPPSVAYAIQERAESENPDAGPDGRGFRDDNVAYTLEARSRTQSVAPVATHGAEGRNGAGIGRAGDPAMSLQADERQGVLAAVPRRLTPRECERLQGFPDDWTRYGTDEASEVVELADSPRYRCLGNAVSVPVAAWIGRRIMQVASQETA